MIEFFLGFAIIVFLVWTLAKPDKRALEYGDLIPGPPKLPLIGNAYSLPFYGPDAIPRQKEMIEKYGKTIRFWAGKQLMIFLMNAEDVEIVLGSTELITKADLYEFAHSWLGTGLLTSTGNKWHMRRKAITPTFHFKILEQFVTVFNRCGTILVDCLEKECDKGDFDVYPYINRYTLDVICETAMGTKTNAQIDLDSKYLRAIRSICSIISERISKPLMYNNLIYALSGNLSKEKEVLKTLDKHALEIIKEKSVDLNKSNGIASENKEENDFGIKKKTAFLELLLKMKSENNKAFTSDDDIREEVNTFMFEGHDTTSAGIAFCLYELAKNPDVQEKVYREVLENISPSNEATIEDFQKLKYLDRVIKEAQRLHPSVPFIGRIATEDTKLASGYFVPKGSMLGVNIYYLHRNEKYFANPDKFNPDNFLPEETVKRHPYAYVPFSAGPRNCIGQKFAMLELKSVISKIVLNYKLSLAGGDWKLIPDPRLILTSSTGHRLRITKRQS